MEMLIDGLGVFLMGQCDHLSDREVSGDLKWLEFEDQSEWLFDYLVLKFCGSRASNLNFAFRFADIESSC